jgi:hypothetical protein
LASRLQALSQQRGTGAMLEPFRDIDRPIDFRN